MIRAGRWDGKGRGNPVGKKGDVHVRNAGEVEVQELLRQSSPSLESARAVDVIDADIIISVCSNINVACGEGNIDGGVERGRFMTRHRRTRSG